MVAPLAAFAVVAALVVVARGTPALDLSLLRSAARHQNAAAIDLAQTITSFGAVLVVLAMLACWRPACCGARGRAGSAAFVVVATLLAMTASGLMKLAFARPRPEVFRQTPGSCSFPSGHTASATGFAVALVIALWGTRWRVPALVAGALYAVGMGLTRVYLRLPLSHRRRRRLGARACLRRCGVARVRLAARPA